MPGEVKIGDIVPVDDVKKKVWGIIWKTGSERTKSRERRRVWFTLKTISKRKCERSVY